MTMCHCNICDEPAPRCEHGVNIAARTCDECTVRFREELAEHYEVDASMLREKMEEMELMARTVWALNPIDVALEWQRLCAGNHIEAALVQPNAMPTI